MDNAVKHDIRDACSTLLSRINIDSSVMDRLKARLSGTRVDDHVFTNDPDVDAIASEIIIKITVEELIHQHDAVKRLDQEIRNLNAIRANIDT